MLILGGLINTQLEKSLYIFAGITFDDDDYLGGSINTQLEKSLYIFAGITFDNVDSWGWGVDQHTTWEVTLHLCWDYL